MTVVVPTYNEAANIAARLRNLATCDYPRDRIDVVVVDSGSDDGTAGIAESAAREDPQVRARVIRQTTRAGKAAAINEAIAQSAAEVMVVTDAPTVYEIDTLRHIGAAFVDPDVGAATGYFEVTGDGGALQREEERFWRIRNTLRSMEARADSTPFLSGELCAFRRRLVPALHEDTLADDVDIALQVRRQGYRVIVEGRARFHEPRSSVARELTTTKSRRAAGGVQELLRSRDMLFNSAHGIFGLLILPSAWLYYLPLRIPAAAVIALAALSQLRRWPPPLQFLAVVAALITAPRLARRYGEQAAMLLFNEWIFLLGWWRLVARRMDVKWTQERTTRVPREPIESRR
jgi:cellulose synthase/poly-beta-1,6-N-acetylglucosamine synthase-like glycosyltransferase